MSTTDQNDPSQFNPDSPEALAAQQMAAEAIEQAAAEAAPPSLEMQLALAQADAASHKDNWLRAVAEVENVRRRAREDETRARDYGVSSFASRMVEVRDFLEMALADQSSNTEQIKMGVTMTLERMKSAFESSRIKEVAVKAGDKFDPHQMESSQQVESDQPEGSVVAVLQKGYVLAERVLRPARVTIAKAAASNE
jgi:molecular chaperone GrpE